MWVDLFTRMQHIREGYRLEDNKRISVIKEVEHINV